MTIRHLNNRIAEKQAEVEDEKKRRSEVEGGDKVAKQWGQESQRVIEGELAALKEALDLVEED